MKLNDYLTSGKVYIIAEMSANHAHSLDVALGIVDAAKAAGADCLKTQLYTADTLTIDCDNELFTIKEGLWRGQTLYELYKSAAMPWSWQEPIMKRCKEVGIDFLATPYDKQAVDYLRGLGVDAFKIASFEMVDIPFISYAAAQGKPLILSCGMCSELEIQEALVACYRAGNFALALMKCSSEYPASVDDLNLNTIPDMAHRFDVPVGFSDHSQGVIASVIACCLGARIIEKHICLDKSRLTPDVDFSLDPGEFAGLVQSIRTAGRARGEVSYGASAAEKASLVFRRSLFAVEDIEKGRRFTEHNVRSIRPGYGLPPKFYGQLLGRVAKRSIKRGQPILPSDLGEKI